MRLDYGWERMYILLYHWIDGLDAVQASQAGMLSSHTVQRMTELARDTLFAMGWVVLDHKPRHLIVRPSHDGAGVLSRQGQPVWALVDYEMLFPL